jgi:hypothetical protein
VFTLVREWEKTSKLTADEAACALRMIVRNPKTNITRLAQNNAYNKLVSRVNVDDLTMYGISDTLFWARHLAIGKVFPYSKFKPTFLTDLSTKLSEYIDKFQPHQLVNLYFDLEMVNVQNSRLHNELKQILFDREIYLNSAELR